MSILVTGAAGFIGCNNVLALNERGITDIIAVDNLERGEKYQNLAKCSISDYFDKRDFIARVRDGSAPKPEAIFHQGACSDTYSKSLDQVLRRELKSLRAPVMACATSTSTAATSSTRAGWPSVPFHQYFHAARARSSSLKGCLGYGQRRYPPTSSMSATSARCLCTSSTSPSPASTTAARGVEPKE